MMSFHRSRRSLHADAASDRDQLDELPTLAVEAYTGHSPNGFYADLGFRPPAR
jgi:hypothetical protein